MSVFERVEIFFARALHRNLVKLERSIEAPSTLGAVCITAPDCATDGYPTTASSCTAGICQPASCASDSQCGSSVCRSNVCMQVTSFVEYGYDTDRKRNQTVVHRLGTSADEAHTTTSFDEVGRSTGILTKDGTGATVSEVRYVYDDLDRLTEVKRRVGIADVKKMIAYEYDAAGNLESASYFDVADQVNPKSVTEYRHDDFGRLVRA